MLGSIVSATGWTLPQVRALDLWDVDRLLTYWLDHPPAHLTLARIGRWLGALAPPEGTAAHRPTKEELQAAAEAFKGASIPRAP